MIGRLLCRLLGVRSPSRDIGSAVARGLTEGVRAAEAEPAQAAPTSPEDAVERLRAAVAQAQVSGVVERSRAIRRAWDDCGDEVGTR